MAYTQDQFDAVLRKDFMAFMCKAAETLLPSVAIKRNWHLEAMAAALGHVRDGSTKNLLITLPPRSLKSVMASVAYPAFVLGHDPGTRIICVSYAQDLAAKHARDFRRILNTDWYRRIFPRVRITKDTEGMIETSMGGARLSTSVGGVVTGMGGSLIIVDDPLKPDDAPSQLARDKGWRYFTQTLLSRHDDKREGTMIVVAQRLHEDDLPGRLLRDPAGGWVHLNLPAIAPKDELIDIGGGRFHQRHLGDVLHSAREPKEELDRLAATMGSAAFSAQYLQAPIPAAGNMVKPGWFRRYDTLPPRDGGRVTQSWDTAYKGDSQHDWSVCTTWLEHDGKHYLLDVARQKLEFSDLIKMVDIQADKWKPDAVLVEDKASGISLLQVIRGSYHSINAIPIQTKDDKETRFNRVTPMFEAGKVWFPKEAQWLALLESELLGFPQSAHDDQVDSVAQYLSWARDRGTFVLEFRPYF
jgi:predicted phage terminase large subunit-like protein